MKRIIVTENAPKAVAAYSQAVELNGTLFVSGQIPLNPVSMQVVEGGIAEQTLQVMKNLGAILEAAGYSYADVVKTTCMLSDISNFKAMNEVYGSYFPENKPARAAYAVKDLPLGVLIEIDAIAMK